MKKKGRIVGIGGGFHNVRYRGFRVSAEAYEAEIARLEAIVAQINAV